MTLVIHRRKDVEDLEVRMVKTFANWATVHHYEEIPLDDAESLSEALIKTLPEVTLAELTRLLAIHASRAEPAAKPQTS